MAAQGPCTRPGEQEALRLSLGYNLDCRCIVSLHPRTLPQRDWPRHELGTGSKAGKGMGDWQAHLWGSAKQA